MNIGSNGHLSQMRDHNHLMCLCQIGENGGERHRRRAADACIDLIEKKRIDAVRLTERHLDGEHHTADLATRSDARKRASLHATSGAKHEFNLMRTLFRPLIAR